MKTVRLRAPTFEISEIDAMMREIRRIIGDTRLTHSVTFTGAFPGWRFSASPFEDAEELAHEMNAADIAHELARRAHLSLSTPPAPYGWEESIEIEKRTVGGLPAVEAWALWSPTKL